MCSVWTSIHVASMHHSLIEGLRHDVTGHNMRLFGMTDSCASWHLIKHLPALIDWFLG
jgi:hypothetical protein